MSIKLEQFIKENRRGFDSVEPSGNLWQNINTSISHPGFFAGKVSWLKYFLFGASAISVITYLSFNPDNSANSQVLNHKIKEDNALSEITDVEKPVVKNNEPVKSENYIIPTKNSLFFIPSPDQNEQSTETINEEYNFPNQLNTGVYKPSTTSSPYSGFEDPQNNIWLEKDNKLKVDTAFSGIKSIVVNSSGFDVNIKSGLDEKVFFNADLSIITKGLILNKSKHRISYLVKDSVLSITVENSGKDVFFVGVYEEKGSLNFDLPKTTNVSVNNTYGDVSAEGLEGKSVNIYTNAGSIKVENISTNLDLKSDYGDVIAKKITGDINARISSGSLKINDINGNLDIKTTYGDQSYNNIKGNLKLATTSGDVKIMEMTGDINTASSYGDISLENFIGSPLIKSSSGDIKGKNVMLTDSMTVISSYGNIKMNILNNPADLSFDLKTSYGKITCDLYEKKLEAEHELLIDKGNIRIKGITSSGDQSYR